MEELRTEAIEHKSGKLLGNLSMEKGIEIERIKKIELRLEKLTVPKAIVNAVRKLVISEKYLYHILRHKNIVLNRRLKS